jgi:predicted TIM-barrel fold metal-dependent hydrolase
MLGDDMPAPPRSQSIIDAHHHIWRLADLPWLSGPPVPRIFGEYGAIRRDYPIEEYLADATPGGVVRSVYVQTNWPPARAVDEVAWVRSVADRHGFPHAIVAYADLAAPDVSRTLDAMQAAPGLRGIRQQLHWHADPRYRFAARPDLVSDPAWRRGLREVGQRGLLFELQVFAGQMADAARLADEVPEVRLVLLHAGMLEDRSPDGWQSWRAGMQQLARRLNVCVKLSGLGTFEHRCSVELWRPVVEETLTLFGADRCLFGSNFPVEKLWTSYAQLLDVMTDCLAGLTARERRAVWHDTAARIYHLGESRG